MKQPLRVAIVGVGVGKQHISAYQELPEQFEAAAVRDIDAAKARATADELRIPRAVADLAELCALDDIDVIDICTPPYLHFALIAQVLAAGKDAVCEKPLVGSLKAVDELIAIEAASGPRVMPIFQYRFGHGLQKLKFLVNEGLAGKAFVATVETARIIQNSKLKTYRKEMVPYGGTKTLRGGGLRLAVAYVHHRDPERLR